MAPKTVSEVDSSVPSSTILPLKLRPRRGSVKSISSIAPAERAALSQALDQIHSTASHSEGLTTFSHFAAPPSSSSGNDGKGIAIELQGGLSGLYNRFRASVGGAKDAGDGRNDDTSSTKGNSTIASVIASNTKQNARGTRHSSPSATLTTRTKSTEQIISNPPLHSSVSQNSDSSSLKNSEQSNPKDRVSTQVLGIKPTLLISGVGKAAPALAQAGILSSAERSLVEVNVTATTTANLSSRASSQGRDASLDKVSRTGSQTENDASSNEVSTIPRPEDVGNPTMKLLSYDIREHRTQSPRLPYTSVLEHENLPQDMAYLEDERRLSTRLKNTCEVKENVLDPRNSTDAGEHNFPSVQQGALATVDRTDDGREDIPGVSSSRSSFDQKLSTHSEFSHQQRGNAHVVAGTISSQQLPRLPGLNLSRASSTDTGGASSISTAIMNRSARGDVSGEETLQIPGNLLAKAKATTQTSGDTRGVNVVLSQIRSKVLSKEYWMKDENARDCFYCGDPFSTFRRKHHCSRSNLRN